MNVPDVTPAPFDARAALAAGGASARARQVGVESQGVFVGTQWSRAAWRGPRVSEK